MWNLLCANFFRLRKSVLFWGLLGVMFALGTAFTLQHIQYQLQRGTRFYLTIDLFSYALLLGFGMAVFIPLFFGAEHSDGAMRNKLTAGHLRVSIYLTHLITGAAVSALAAAAYVLPVFVLGLFFFEPPALDADEMIPGKPNPRYVGGAKRAALETIYDLLPTGQSLQYMHVEAAHPERLALYSLSVIVLSTGTGILLFRRKDLR